MSRPGQELVQAFDPFEVRTLKKVVKGAFTRQIWQCVLTLRFLPRPLKAHLSDTSAKTTFKVGFHDKQ
jgi:hypothetical protein